MTVSPVSSPTTPAVVKKTKTLAISQLKKTLRTSKSKAVAIKKLNIIKNPNSLNSKLAALKISITKLENVINQMKSIVGLQKTI